MFAIELTAQQEQALRRLVGILDAAHICYQFTGGFAGNLHGSLWPLHDLDIDVARQDLPRLAELLSPYTTQPLGLFVDDEFELQLLRAEMDGVPIDACQAEEGYAIVRGQRVPLGVNLARRQRMLTVLDLEVWVQPLPELIAYKTLLGRSADLADLRALSREMPAEAADAVVVRPVRDWIPLVERVLHGAFAQLRSLLPNAELHHIGSTALPVGVTKGDVDLLVRVSPENFAPTVEAFKQRFAMKQPENWTTDFASFGDDQGYELPLGIQVVVKDSSSDFLLYLRDYFLAHPEALEQYNRLKTNHAHEGAESYWRAKDAFLQSILAARATEESA